MPTTIAQTSIETVSRLLRAEFDQIDMDMEYIHGSGSKLIQTAKDYGFAELATEMENDLKQL